MSPRFALRWTLVGLICALAIVAAGLALATFRPMAPAQRPVSIDDLMAAALMPLDSRGAGTQVISGITLSFRLAPYPARASVPSTITLVTVAPDGNTPALVTPTLFVAQGSQADAREFAMPRQADQSYAAGGMFFPRPGPWRLRVDVAVGDEAPASMLVAVDAR